MRSARGLRGVARGDAVLQRSHGGESWWGDTRPDPTYRAALSPASPPLDNTQEVPAASRLRPANGTVIVDAAPNDALTQNHTSDHVHRAQREQCEAAISTTSVKQPSYVCRRPTCNGPVILGFPTLSNQCRRRWNEYRVPGRGIANERAEPGGFLRELSLLQRSQHQCPLP